MFLKPLGEDGHRRLRALAERFGRGNLAARLGLSEEALDSVLSGYYQMSEEGVTNLGLLIDALEWVPAEARGSPGEEGLYRVPDEDDVNPDEEGVPDGVVDAGPARIVGEHVGDGSAEDEVEWSAGEFGGVSGLREDTSLPDRELAEVMKQDMGVVTEAGARTLERIAVESERPESPAGVGLRRGRVGEVFRRGLCRERARSWGWTSTRTENRTSRSTGSTSPPGPAWPGWNSRTGGGCLSEAPTRWRRWPSSGSG